MRVRNLGLEELARIQWIWMGHSALSILERTFEARNYFDRTLGGVAHNRKFLDNHRSIRIQGEQTHQTQMPLRDLDMITNLLPHLIESYHVRWNSASFLRPGFESWHDFLTSIAIDCVLAAQSSFHWAIVLPVGNRALCLSHKAPLTRTTSLSLLANNSIAYNTSSCNPCCIVHLTEI